MARFTFEICQLKQVEELVEYIDSNWAKDHILVTSRELLDWQHKSKQGDYYNFVMARHNKTGKICGVLGFIPTSQFSEGLQAEKEVWLAIWKVNEGPKFIGLGLGLLNFLKKEFDIEKICSIGISPIAFPMYKVLGFDVGFLEQLVLVNRNIKSYVIAKIPLNYKPDNLVRNEKYALLKLNEANLNETLKDSVLYNSATRKDFIYILNRYVGHPKYKYNYFGVYESGKLVLFLVMRVVQCNNSSVIRCVDAQGDLTKLSMITGELHDFLEKYNHEYMDIMQYGFENISLLKSGFSFVSDDDGLIIPDYFEPFVQKNIHINFARQTQNPEDKYFLFKGDSDQDRPNVM